MKGYLMGVMAIVAPVAGFTLLMGIARLEAVLLPGQDDRAESGEPRGRHA